MVDTGFGGGILIPYSLYEEFRLTLFEVPDRYYGVLPVGLPITLHTAVTEVSWEMSGLKPTFTHTR